MLKRVLNHTLVYLLAAVVVLADQYSKHLVRTRLPLNTSWSPQPWLAQYVRVLHIQNTGAAFGIFKEAGLFFTAVAVVVTLVIIVYTQRLPAGHWWMRIALGMQLGGALGNLVDRLVFGTVTDFISVGNFAIFNIADASISVGVVLLALMMWFEARAERGQSQSGSTLPPVDIGETS
ncbi:MAG: signal peptidase II [Anaerolineales bacterium]